MAESRVINRVTDGGASGRIWKGALPIMKVLLTGASGFLGSRALAFFRERGQVAAIPSSLLRGEWTAQWENALHAAVAEAAPDVLLHMAAISDTGYAEQHPEESYQANVALPLALARIAAREKVKLVCCSSDQVYNGCGGSGPFAETEPLQPVNVYGRHKLEAEARVSEASPEAVSLRLTWMYDLPGYGLPTHRNLLTNLLGAALRGETLTLSTTDTRGVTYARQVVENLPRAFGLPGGAYNFGSEGDRSVYAVALAWCEALGLDADRVRPMQGRPRSLLMDGAAAASRGICFDTTAEGIRRCMADYGWNALLGLAP